MAITIKKQVQKAQAQDHVEGLSDFSAEIDAIGKLAEDADALEITLTKAVRDKLNKIAALRKEAGAKAKELATQITIHLDELAMTPNATTQEEGTKYIAEVGKRGTLRSIIDLSTVKTLMDDQDEDLFMKLAKMNIGDIDAYLTPEERSLVLKTTLQNRSLKIVPRVL